MEKGSHKPRFPVAEKLGLEEPLHCIRMEFAEGVIFGADVLDAHQVKEDVRESSGRDKDVFGLEELNTCLEAEFASPHYNVGPMKSSGGIDAGMEDSLAVLLFSAEDGRLVLDEVQVRLVSAKSIKDCALLVHNHGKLAGTVAEGGCSKVGVRVIQAEVGLGVRVGDGGSCDMSIGGYLGNSAFEADYWYEK